MARTHFDLCRRVRASLVILVAIFASGAGADEVKQNLLPNASFESGLLLPELWQAYRPEGTVVRSDAIVFHTGAQSVKITGDADARHYPNLSFATPASAGEVYYGKVWCKTDAFRKGVGAYCTISFLHQGRRLSWVQGEFIGVQRKDWSLLAVQGTRTDGNGTG
jgi:hypothetical protein